MEFNVHHGEKELPSEHFRVVITSDTHTLANNLIVPDGDIFIQCGDFLRRSKIN